MKRKVLDYLNPRPTYEYSSNAQPRMNSKKQRRYHNERSHVEERQHYYPHKRHKEGNERSHVEERQHDYPHRRHEEDVNYDPYGVNFDRGHDHSQCLLIRKQRKERRPDIHPYLFVTEEERALMPIPSPSNKRELDNDDLPEFDDYQRLLDEDEFPVFDYDRYTESLQKLADYWSKALDKARQRESAKFINHLDLDYQF